MAKKTHPNACRGHLYGGSEAGFPPPISRKRTLSLRRGRVACVLRRLALFPAVVEGFATLDRLRAVAIYGTGWPGIAPISGQKSLFRALFL